MSRMSAIGWGSDRSSARHGADQWWAQRVNALALALLSVWFVISLQSIPTISYATLREWMSRGWNAVPLGALILVVAQHSYLGLRVVVEDYVHNPGARIAILLLLQFLHVLVAAGTVFAVFKVALGALA
jgi:succinate dehydrogenase / fumarate reductase, membrane anchor subunit